MSLSKYLSSVSKSRRGSLLAQAARQVALGESHSQFEPLEARRMMAAVVVNGDIGGIPANDTIVVRLRPTDTTILEALVNGAVTYQGPAANVTKLTVNGLNGNDNI